MATKPKPLPVADLVLDGGTQSRVAIDEYTVDRYVDVLESSDGSKWPFPPLIVFHDGSRHLVSSGFHRTLAAIRCGLKTVPCIVCQGTAWDALVDGMGANKDHGLPPSRADNHHSVVLLLESDKKLTTKQIADIVGVTTRTVRRISAEVQKRTMSAPDDPFAVDEPATEGGQETVTEGGQESGTETVAQNGKRLPTGGTKTTSGESSVSPEQAFATQRSKTVKTAEALMRAFDDLQAFKAKQHHRQVIEKVAELVSFAKNWR